MTSATLEPVINFEGGAEPHRQTQLNLRSSYSIASSNTSTDRKKELHLETFQIVRIQIEVEVEGCLGIRSVSFLSNTVKSRNIWLSYFRYNLYFRFRLFVGLFRIFEDPSLGTCRFGVRHFDMCVWCVSYVLILYVRGVAASAHFVVNFFSFLLQNTPHKHTQWKRKRKVVLFLFFSRKSWFYFICPLFTHHFPTRSWSRIYFLE